MSEKIVILHGFDPNDPVETEPGPPPEDPILAAFLFPEEATRFGIIGSDLPTWYRALGLDPENDTLDFTSYTFEGRSYQIVCDDFGQKRNKAISRVIVGGRHDGWGIPGPCLITRYNGDGDTLSVDADIDGPILERHFQK